MCKTEMGNITSEACVCFHAPKTKTVHYGVTLMHALNVFMLIVEFPLNSQQYVCFCHRVSHIFHFSNNNKNKFLMFLNTKVNIL